MLCRSEITCTKKKQITPKRTSYSSKSLVKKRKNKKYQITFEISKHKAFFVKYHSFLPLEYTLGAFNTHCYIVLFPMVCLLKIFFVLTTKQQAFSIKDENAGSILFVKQITLFPIVFIAIEQKNSLILAELLWFNHTFCLYGLKMSDKTETK